MHLITADGTFNVGPSLGVIAWVLLVWTVIALGGGTAAKGQWMWFAVGIVTGGIGWVVGAFRPARGGSWAARRRANADQMTAGYGAGHQKLGAPRRRHAPDRKGAG